MILIIIEFSRDAIAEGVHAKTSNGDESDLVSFDERLDLTVNDNSDTFKMVNSSLRLETLSETPIARQESAPKEVPVPGNCKWVSIITYTEIL